MKPTIRILILAGFAGGLILGLLPSCGQPKTCNLSTCASGCCDPMGNCELGTLNSACGTSGAACVAQAEARPMRATGSGSTQPRAFGGRPRSIAIWRRERRPKPHTFSSFPRDSSSRISRRWPSAAPHSPVYVNPHGVVVPLPACAQMRKSFAAAATSVPLHAKAAMPAGSKYWP